VDYILSPYKIGTHFHLVSEPSPYLLRLRSLAADYPIFYIFTIPKLFLGQIIVSMLSLVVKALRNFQQFGNVAVNDD